MTTDVITSTAPEATIQQAVKPVRQSAGGRDNRGPTRAARLINMLSRKSGADVVAISKSFGWQPHTARAALSRLRKAGHDVIRVQTDKSKPARYRIQKMPRETTVTASLNNEADNAG